MIVIQTGLSGIFNIRFCHCQVLNSVRFFNLLTNDQFWCKHFIFYQTRLLRLCNNVFFLCQKTERKDMAVSPYTGQEAGCDLVSKTSPRNPRKRYSDTNTNCRSSQTLMQFMLSNSLFFMTKHFWTWPV